MATYFSFEHWHSLNSEEQQRFLLLFPFSHTVNLGKGLITYYWEELKQIPTKYQDNSWVQKGKTFGWWKKLKTFPHTQMMTFHPLFNIFLKQQASALFSQSTYHSIERGFIRYYRVLSADLYEMYADAPSEEHIKNLQFISLEYENLLAALWLSLKHHEYEFTPILLLINTYLSTTRQDEERQYLNQQLLNTLEQSSQHEQNTQWKFSLVDVYDSLGTAALYLRDYKMAETHYHNALILYQKYELSKSYSQGQRTLYQNLAAVTACQEKWVESKDYYYQMKALATKDEDTEGIADFYLNYGYNLYRQGLNEEALSFFQVAAENYKVLERPEWYATAIKFQGAVFISLQQFDAAKKLLDEATIIFQSLNDQYKLASSYDEYFLLYFGKKEFLPALECAKKAVTIYIDTGDKVKEGLAYLNLCSACAGLQDFEQCASYLRKAVQIFLHHKVPTHIWTTLNIASLTDQHRGSQLLPEVIDLYLSKYSSEELGRIVNQGKKKENDDWL